METINNEFIKSLDELSDIFKDSQKIKIVEFLKNNFKENVHYIKEKVNNNKKEGRGGHNKINYLLTNKTFELVKSSFNLKHRYLTKINDNCNHVNIVMSLENQTIGFIENSFKDVLKMKRQKSFGAYRVDLYFYDYKLIIECDEKNHSDRNEDYEKKREEYLISLENIIIRYNPNHENFDLSLVIREINKIILSNKINNAKIITVNFD
jgi:very-short-patch-repair endonuclease